MKPGLYPCNATYPNTYTPHANYGRWLLGKFKTDPNGAGTLELGGGAALCLTVMTCDAPVGTDFCNPESEVIAWDVVNNVERDLRRGAYLRLRPCYNNGGNPLFVKVQKWRARLDCAVGCLPQMQDDDVCDPECNNAACNWDNTVCLTKAPTPPTTTPTRRGETPQPTILTTSSPTFVLTNAPSSKNTKSPSQNPTMSPTVACPVNQTLEFCGRFGETGCKRQKLAKVLCTYCLGECRPKQGGDPRVCQDPHLFDHCQAACPTEDARRKCQPTLIKEKCGKLCRWCPLTSFPPGTVPSNRCVPGKDRRACTRPDLYDHCGTLAPTFERCISIAKVENCFSRTTAETCSGPCTWCENASSYQCRPTSKLFSKDELCLIQGNPIFESFPQCPQLFPKPTRSPVVRTNQPSSVA
jgi:hypothetical protein